MSEEDTGAGIAWLRRIFDRLVRVGIRGADGVNIVSDTNRLPVDLGADPTIEIGTVNQGDAGADPWLVIGPVTEAQLADAGLAVEAGGNLETTAAKTTVISNRFSPSTGNAVAATASGDTIVYTPTAGKKIRLKWIGFSTSPAMPATTRVQAKFNSGGTPFYDWFMGAPGAFAHGTVRESAVDDVLYVNCSVAPGGATPLLVNFDLEEF